MQSAPAENSTPDAVDHVAIMSKASGFIEKILSGHKTIESRWYATRRPPWGRVHAGDTVYFKYSGGAGERVKVRATVDRVQQFENIDQDGAGQSILDQYAAHIFGADMSATTPTEAGKRGAAEADDGARTETGATKRRGGTNEGEAERRSKKRRKAQQSEKTEPLWRGKKYCILVWLKDVTEVEDPFLINKQGFGKMTAWLTVPSISQILLPED
jgi:ASC-1-like (ASCH) protein